MFISPKILYLNKPPANEQVAFLRSSQGQKKAPHDGMMKYSINSIIKNYYKKLKNIDNCNKIIDVVIFN